MAHTARLGVVVALALGIAGCGAPVSAPPTAHPVRTATRSRSAPVSAATVSISGVPAALHPALVAALATFRTAHPVWHLTAPATTITANAGAMGQTGVLLHLAWTIGQSFLVQATHLHLQATASLGTDGVGTFPAVGIPPGQANLTAPPNLALVQGTVGWTGGTQVFQAVLAHVATDWELVSWTWKGAPH